MKKFFVLIALVVSFSVVAYAEEVFVETCSEGVNEQVSNLEYDISSDMDQGYQLYTYESSSEGSLIDENNQILVDYYDLEIGQDINDDYLANTISDGFVENEELYVNDGDDFEYEESKVNIENCFEDFEVNGSHKDNEDCKNETVTLSEYYIYEDVSEYVNNKNVFYIPDFLSVIESEAFSGISAEVIVVPENCTSIDGLAFSNCENLSYVLIPEALKESVPADAIQGSYNASVVFYSKTTNDYLDTENEVVSDEPTDTTIQNIISANESVNGSSNVIRINVQPQSAKATYGDIVVFCVDANNVSNYQWQACDPNGEWYDLTAITGCRTNELSVQVILNRSFLQYRCYLTGINGDVMYTSEVYIEIEDADIIVNGNESIKYDVPLYNQGKYSLCWDYCQQMVEDFILGIEHVDKVVEQLCYERAVEAYGDEWNNGGLPTDESWDVVWDDEVTIEKIYQLLLKNGPLYANYNNGKLGHMVVVTGVEIENGKVYTNNPWRVSGEQKFDEFVDMFDTGNHRVNYSLPLLYVSWSEWE